MLLGEVSFQPGSYALGMSAMGKCPSLSGEAMLPPWSLSPCMNPICRGVPGWNDIPGVSEARGQEVFSSLRNYGDPRQGAETGASPHPEPGEKGHGHMFRLPI